KSFANRSASLCGGILPEFWQNSQTIPQTVSLWADGTPTKSLLHWRRRSVLNRRTHYEYGVMPWQENTCGLRDSVLRVLDPGANEARISDNPPRIPPLFRHYPVTIWRRRSESNR